MDNLVKEIFEIIKDYREDERLMSEEIIKTWIEQFNKDDREFILEELKNIFQKRYISKAKAKELMSEMIKFLTDHFKEDSPEKLINASFFIDVQPEGKSQKELLKFVEEIIQEEYGMSISNCDFKTAKYYIYIDDLLCTGDTLFKNLAAPGKGWFHQVSNTKSNLTIFKDNNAKLVLSYFAIHKFNIDKALRRIYLGLGKKETRTVYAWDEDYAIENDISDSNSKLNFLFPTDTVIDEIVKACQNQIETKIHEAGYHEDEQIKY